MFPKPFRRFIVSYRFPSPRTPFNLFNSNRYCSLLLLLSQDLQALSMLGKDMEALRIEHHRNVRREEGHCMEFVRTKTIEIVNAEAASYDEILKGSASAIAKITGKIEKE